MKRRLPTTYQGETVLAAISLPPLTDDANRHAPSRSHPGKPAAAENAAPIAASANRPASAAGRIASPPSSTASAANPVPSSPARARNRRTQPRGRIRNPQPCRCRAHPACAACHLPDYRADRLGHVQPPGQHERRQQRMAHPARAAAHPGHEDLPAAARRPDMPPVTGPEHQRPGARRADRARDLHLAASCHISIDRQRARPYDGHGRLTASGSLLAVGAKRGEKGSFTFSRDRKILARTAATRRPHRQRARPDTRPRCSGNQAVNTRQRPVTAGSGPGAGGAGCCDTRSHVVSELVEEVWLMPET